MYFEGIPIFGHKYKNQIKLGRNTNSYINGMRERLASQLLSRINSFIHYILLICHALKRFSLVLTCFHGISSAPTMIPLHTKRLLISKDGTNNRLTR